LPGEVRTKIWEYVAGEDGLHVTLRQRQEKTIKRKTRYRFTVTLCRANIKDGEAATTIRNETHATEIASCAQRHKDCVTGSMVVPTQDANIRQYSVAWLQTCRQIHEEAALLPFTLNNFILSDLDDIHYFPARLMRTQRKQIHSITLGTDTMYPTRKQATMLEGLQQVTIFIDQRSQQNAMSLVTSAARWDLSRCLIALKPVLPVRATVCIYEDDNKPAWSFPASVASPRTNPEYFTPLAVEFEAKFAKATISDDAQGV
jgi:hypothetical protein